MRAIGVVRRVDELGRFVIPKELRHSLSIENGDRMEIYVQGEMIVLEKYRPSCMFCGSHEQLYQFKGSQICGACIEAARRI
ncbi:MAG: AbrB/MazE/SpoVT family DNA-binding domain-containing protein [Bacillota bacterium]|jgi:transcriptional pleiotropic regulator of transition state genes|nr:AbrB/MazE/SpoVT family DNA-binding domain-containing protein [Bacillota bacterium]